MIKVKKEKEKICNHNPNDINTTLKKMDKRTMVLPRIDEYVCKTCHKFFEFSVIENE